MSSDNSSGKGSFQSSVKKLPFIGRLARAIRGRQAPSDSEIYLRDLRDLLIFQQTQELQRAHRNPLNQFGAKCFSQTDEDGITLEILRRIGKLEGGTFGEFGVGDGTENNTLVLKALGWKGFWIGGQPLKIAPPIDGRFCYLREWITLDNIVQLAQQARAAVGADTLDVISLDLDGNDIYFVDRILGSGLQPSLFIVEYNAKFLPPVRWQIAYDAGHTWKGDDYFGASLASFVDVFERHGYRLVCCNSHSGANAFFVKESMMNAFQDVPRDIRDIFVPPRYQLYRSYGHRKSLRTITRLFES